MGREQEGESLRASWGGGLLAAPGPGTHVFNARCSCPYQDAADRASGERAQDLPDLGSQDRAAALLGSFRCSTLGTQSP